MKDYKKAEKQVAKDLGGKRRPYSGALPCLKGDVATDELLVEVKYTRKKGFRVGLNLIAKINNEAYGAGKEPGIVICFEDNYGNSMIDTKWILLPLRVFKKINEKVRGNIDRGEK